MCTPEENMKVKKTIKTKFSTKNYSDCHIYHNKKIYIIDLVISSDFKNFKRLPKASKTEKTKKFKTKYKGHISYKNC